MNTLRGSVLVWLLVSLAPVAQSQEMADVEIEATHVAGKIYMLQGRGGNIGVSVGEDGILIVDDQFAPLADKIRAALKELGQGKLRFVLNTHYHGDHTGGNPEFGREATIIAQSNVRNRLEVGDRSGPMPKQGLPLVTFDDALSVHFNGEEIKAVHLPAGHTDGERDLAVGPAYRAGLEGHRPDRTIQDRQDRRRGLGEVLNRLAHEGLLHCDSGARPGPAVSVLVTDVGPLGRDVSRVSHPVSSAGHEG